MGENTPKYRDDLAYKALEKLCLDAGVRIVYQPVPDDCIDGEIWARSNGQGREITMPDTDCFDTVEMAGLILGHEMAHIITGVDSPDIVPERVRNEAICDLVGYYLYQMAEMIAGAQYEREIFGCDPTE